VPGHLDLLDDLVGAVRPGGWFAFQVPGNFDEPSHTLRDELAAEPAYASYTAGVATPASHDPAAYYDALASAGCAVDVWETTYTHVLSGPDPVFTWVSGTGARPTLQALPDDLRPEFEAEFRRRAVASGQDPDQARASAAAGTPDEVVERIHEYERAGAETVYLQYHTLDEPDHLELIGTEVVAKIGTVS